MSSSRLLTYKRSCRLGKNINSLAFSVFGCVCCCRWKFCDGGPRCEFGLSQIGTLLRDFDFCGGTLARAFGVFQLFGFAACDWFDFSVCERWRKHYSTSTQIPFSLMKNSRKKYQALISVTSLYLCSVVLQRKSSVELKKSTWSYICSLSVSSIAFSKLFCFNLTLVLSPSKCVK